MSDALQYTFSGTLIFHQKDEIVGISGEPVITPLQFFAQRVKHDVGKQWW